MDVLVDFFCPDCRRPHEAWVAKPVPAARPCPVCGQAARRRFGGALLRGAAAASPSRGPAPSTEAPALCQRFPTIPGLCHMTPTAARTWIARARNDGRALDRELERQEKGVAAGDPAMSVPPISHDHDHGPGHGHGSAETSAAGPAPAVSTAEK